MSAIAIDPARPGDVTTICAFVRELAEYERLERELVATEQHFREALFGNRPVVEAVLARLDDVPVGYALFFPTFSTFLGRPGLYLEDLYVQPHARGRGVGKALMTHLARLTVDRGWGRLEWSVLDWNAPSIAFYRSLGATAMEEWTIYRLTDNALRLLAQR